MLACGEDEIGDYVEEYVTRQREGEERERKKRTRRERNKKIRFARKTARDSQRDRQR